MTTTVGFGQMTEQQANEIYEAFGPCTALYECESPSTMIADFYSDSENGKARMSLAEWLDVQLSVEDAFGTVPELIKDAEKRLRVAGFEVSNRNPHRSTAFGKL